MPSPHIVEHELAIVGSPNVQFQPGSTEHVLSQPSPDILFPSSQYPIVGTRTTPPPQVLMHELGVVSEPTVQIQLGSILQLSSQPSPGIVFPSSQ